MNKQSMLTDEGRCLCGCDERCAVVAELRDQIQRLRQAIRVRDEEYALASSATPPAHGDGELPAIHPHLDEAINGAISDLDMIAAGRDPITADKLSHMQVQTIARNAAIALNEAWKLTARPDPEADARDGALVEAVQWAHDEFEDKEHVARVRGDIGLADYYGLCREKMATAMSLPAQGRE